MNRTVRIQPTFIHFLFQENTYTPSRPSLPGSFEKKVTSATVQGRRFFVS